jgi:hypothetical protein
VFAPQLKSSIAKKARMLDFLGRTTEAKAARAEGALWGF